MPASSAPFRDRSSYDCVKPLIAGLPSGALTDPGCPTLGGTSKEFENQPLLRKYNMANRRRSDAHAWLTITPLGNLSIGSHLKYIDDDYYKSTLGRTDYRLLSAGLDLSYAATDALNFHAFYNHDRSKSKMNSSSSATSFDPDHAGRAKTGTPPTPSAPASISMSSRTGCPSVSITSTPDRWAGWTRSGS